MKDKIFRVNYGHVGKAVDGGALVSCNSHIFFSRDYDGRFVTLKEAIRIYESHAPEENEYADYDEFLPICVEVQYFPDTNGRLRGLTPVEYIIYNGSSWFIPLKKGRVKKVSKNEAIKWVENYMKAVKSYEKRVNSLPAPSIEQIFSIEDDAKAAYPTQEELAAMPKAE